MLPKRIMPSSSGSLSKLVIECESLGNSSYSHTTHDSALIQKDFTINMIQNKGYGAINTSTTEHNQTKSEDQVEEYEHEHQGKSPIRSVLWNMLNQIIGTGILGIPYIYKSTGIVGSIIIMLIFGIISVYTLNLIIYCGKKIGVYNYETLLEKSFGIKGYIVSSFCIAILNIGGMLTNLIIIGDATMKVLSIWGFDSWFDRQMILLILSIIIILPFCMFRDLSSLEKAGFVKIIAISVIIVVIFLEFFNSINGEHKGADNITNDITLNLNWASVPSAVGILAFSFVCHDSSFLLYNTLSNPTNKRYFKLSFLGIFIAITFTLSLSIPAYLTFGNSVDFNILNNYDIYNPLIITIRIIYIFTMTLTFPGSFFLVRHIFYAWYQKLQCVYSRNYQNNFMPYTVQTAPFFHHLVFTLSIFICIVCISLFVDDLGIVMSVIGSVSSVNLAFVFPCLCYMKIMLKSEKLCVYRIMLNLIAPLFITLTGIAVAIYGVVSVL